MLARIPSPLLNEWMAFYNLEPWGADAQFMGHGIVASTVANVNREKGSKAFEPKDFMPDFSQEEHEQTVDEMLNVASMFTLAMGGKDDRPEGEPLGMTE